MSVDPIFWLLAAIGFVVLEAMTLNLVSIWFAVGSAAALLSCLVVASFRVQAVVFIAVSILCLLALGFTGWCGAALWPARCPMPFTTVWRWMEEDCERLLIRGDAQITRDGADYLAEKKLVLLGVEQETVGNETSGNDVHQQLLKKGTVIVENLNLEKVTSGHYFLVAAPIQKKHQYGGPIRAVLIEN